MYIVIFTVIFVSSLEWNSNGFSAEHSCALTMTDIIFYNIITLWKTKLKALHSD